jgi:hypothetical protein
MKKNSARFADIGLEDLALVGGGCHKKRNHCNPCNPCDPKLTMTTPPGTANLATLPGVPNSGGLSIDISIGGIANHDAQTIPGAPGAAVTTTTSTTVGGGNGLPGATVGIST